VLSQAVLAAIGVALAACGDYATAPDSLGSFTFKLSDQTALGTVGGVALMTANGSPIAVVRTGATSFTALSRICPHQGSTIGTASGGFRCPKHGATFSLSSDWTGGEHTSNMRSYVTTYDAATDTVTIA
jgi:Rieske Fe-S protein